MIRVNITLDDLPGQPVWSAGLTQLGRQFSSSVSPGQLGYPSHLEDLGTQVSSGSDRQWNWFSSHTELAVAGSAGAVVAVAVVAVAWVVVVVALQFFSSEWSGQSGSSSHLQDQ